VVGAQYNALFNEVVSCDRRGFVHIFNADTGELMLQFGPAHGHADVSSLSFDLSSRRLITTASDRTVKVWNFNIGHSLHSIHAPKRMEPTGAVQLKSGALLTCGPHHDLVAFRMRGHETSSKPVAQVALGTTEDDAVTATCIASCIESNVVLVGTCSGATVAFRADMLTEMVRLRHKGTTV
jgi:WD40 repeat protein